MDQEHSPLRRLHMLSYIVATGGGAGESQRLVCDGSLVPFVRDANSTPMTDPGLHSDSVGLGKVWKFAGL